MALWRKLRSVGHGWHSGRSLLHPAQTDGRCTIRANGYCVAPSELCTHRLLLGCEKRHCRCVVMPGSFGKVDHYFQECGLLWTRLKDSRTTTTVRCTSRAQVLAWSPA